MLQADRAYSAMNATETTEAKIGSFTIPASGVRKIVGVYGTIMQPTATAGEQISGYFYLKFKTVAGVFKFPAMGIGGPAGTLASIGNAQQRQIIGVDIPVPANEVVEVWAAADVALTGTGTCETGIFME